MDTSIAANICSLVRDPGGNLVIHILKSALREADFSITPHSTSSVLVCEYSRLPIMDMRD